MVSFTMNLIAIYTTFFLVCLAQARVPLCKNCALPFLASEPEAADSPAYTFDLPEPAADSPAPADDIVVPAADDILVPAADDIVPAADSQAHAFESLEPAADSPVPADDIEPVVDSQAPESDSQVYAFESLEPAADSPVPADDIEPVVDSQAPESDSQAPAFDLTTPANDSSASDDDLPDLAPIPSPDFSGRGSPQHPAGVFDVTNYGAVADGKTESSLAFLSAWEDACHSDGNSTLLIPDGTFFLGPISFVGPCTKNQSPKIEIRGSLKAPSSANAFNTSTWILFQNLQGLELTGGTEMATLDAQGEEAWSKNKCRNKNNCNLAPRSLKFVNVQSGIISKIALINSKGFHMSFTQSENIDVHSVNFSSPWNSPNTDGIHISYSTNINITSSVIGVGDDCVSIGPGSTDILVFNVTCGPGHGISVGSLGKYPNEQDVRGVSVRNCTIKDTTNGVRIKTWPGAPKSQASNLTFEDILMSNVSNPIIVDQEYCPGHTCDNSEPSLVKLSNISFKNISGTSNTKPTTIVRCSPTVPCENLKLINVNLNYTEDADKTGVPSLSVKGAVHGIKIVGSNLSTKI